MKCKQNGSGAEKINYRLICPEPVKIASWYTFQGKGTEGKGSFVIPGVLLRAECFLYIRSSGSTSTEMDSLPVANESMASMMAARRGPVLGAFTRI